MLLAPALSCPFPPPIADGGVLISENRVAAVGPVARPFPLCHPRLSPTWAKSSCCQAGQCALSSGLYRHGGQPAPKQFPDWIKGLFARKAAASYADYAQSWLRVPPCSCATRYHRRRHRSRPGLLPDVWSSTPLRVASFLEMTGVQAGATQARLCRKLPQKSPRSGLSAALLGFHRNAVYSTSPALLRATANLASLQIGARPCTSPNRLMS